MPTNKLTDDQIKQIAAILQIKTTTNVQKTLYCGASVLSDALTDIKRQIAKLASDSGVEFASVRPVGVINVKVEVEALKSKESLRSEVEAFLRQNNLSYVG
jgi:hypothetical protein